MWKKLRKIHRNSDKTPYDWASIGEQKIIDILEDKDITYYFQYPVKIKNHTLFFDFIYHNIITQ